MTLKAQATENLLLFKGVMEGLDLPFFLMEGTLLGVYRNGDFIEGDEDDIDLGMRSRYFTMSNVNDMTEALEAVGFELTKRFVHPDLGTLEGVSYKRGENHIDVFPIHTKSDAAFMLAKGRGRPGFPPVIAFVYPLECFESFDTIEFLGVKFNIPHDVEVFLAARYGENWRTPLSRAEYDSHDPEQCPCIRTEW